jgi:hypothetical protein
MESSNTDKLTAKFASFNLTQQTPQKLIDHINESWEVTISDKMI